MARKSNLSCLEKRDLLNQSAVSIETLVKWGEQYEAAGLVHDALDFFEKAKARDALERLLGVALEEGDFFLHKRVGRLLDREVSREEWLSLASRAEEQGKARFAAEAYRQAGDEDRAAAVLHRTEVEEPVATEDSHMEEIEVA